MDTFPSNTGISEVRGIVKLAKDNGNSIDISKLAKETKRGIDVLLPAIDACRLFGICAVSGGVVTLTAMGKSLTTATKLQSEMKRRLAMMEPFRSAIEIISSKKNISTEGLSEALKGRGITLYAEKSMNADMVRALMLKWAVRLKLLSYDLKSDSWSLA